MYSNFFQMQNIVIGNVTFSSPAAHVFVNKRNLENSENIYFAPFFKDFLIEHHSNHNMSKLVTRIARSSGHRLLRSSSAATASGQPQRKPFHTGTARLIFEPTYLDVSISTRQFLPAAQRKY